MEEASKYHLSVELAALDHLAEGLYSSVAAVITEAVANAWDADATRVDIKLAMDEDLITISDNGCGMSEAEINSNYLVVAFRRRETTLGDKSPSGNRRVMGRKGIGKLALLAIANKVRLESNKSASGVVNALEIDQADLRSQIATGNKTYSPKEVKPKYKEYIKDGGTLIELTQLRRERLGDQLPHSLRRRLARRFSVVGSDDFRVYVNDEEVTVADRDDLKFAQYVWYMKGTHIEKAKFPNAKDFFEIDCCGDSWPAGEQIQGWIATVDRPRQLTTNEGNLNSIVVMARGRLVSEDVLSQVSGAQIFNRYVTGQINADFLDESDKEDIVTSDRQRLREEDPRVFRLITFLKSSRVLGHIESKWSELRTEDKTDELAENYPGVKDWVDRLESGWQSKARKLLSKIAVIELSATGAHDSEIARKDLLRAAIFGFERLRLRGDAEELASAVEGGVESVLKLLADRDALEAAHYRDIVAGRLAAVKDFEGRVNSNELEKVLQRYLFDHLWLLDPAWERATGDEEMERGIRALEPFADGEAVQDAYGRVDIRYRRVGGADIIVELKRASVRPKVGELLEQLTRYSDILSQHYPNKAFGFVVVLGKVDAEMASTLERAMIGRTGVSSLTVKTYDELILNARQSYAEYLDRTKGIDYIEKMFDQDASA